MIQPGQCEFFLEKMGISAERSVDAGRPSTVPELLSPDSGSSNSLNPMKPKTPKPTGCVEWPKSPDGEHVATVFSCSGGGAAGYTYTNVSCVLKENVPIP